MPATFDQLDLISGDVDRLLAFYRLLGLTVPEDSIWRTASGAHHVHLEMPDGATLSFNSAKLAPAFNRSFTGQGRGGNVVIGFSVASRKDVDAKFAEMTAAGHKGLQPPFDAFWGSRYAIVEDPDGNNVGIMSPADPAKRSPGPEL